MLSLGNNVVARVFKTGPEVLCNNDTGAILASPPNTSTGSSSRSFLTVELKKVASARVVAKYSKPEHKLPTLDISRAYLSNRFWEITELPEYDACQKYQASICLSWPWMKYCAASRTEKKASCQFP